MYPYNDQKKVVISAEFGGPVILRLAPVLIDICGYSTRPKKTDQIWANIAVCGHLGVSESETVMSRFFLNMLLKNKRLNLLV